MSAITALLEAARSGDQAAQSQLYERLYSELRTIAHARLREVGLARHAVLLDTVSLVHESYVKLVGTGQLALADRQHFLAYAARTMRSIVVDELRRIRADKHGGGAAMVTLTTGLLDANPCDNVDALRVHEAMQELGEIDARLERTVELRFFAGLTEAEAAAVLGVSTRTVQRDWEKARLFLSSVLES